ncbi:MAG: DUF1189 family protein [Elusimicrobiota bacterium]
MLILDPVNAITSVSFYRKAAKRTLGRAALYLCYLAVIFSILGDAALKIRLGPAINQTFDWLERAAPPLVFSGGKFSSTAPMPVVLRHPDYADIAVAIDTTRTTPVTEPEMESQGVTAYLTQSDFYLRRPNGTVEDRNFSDAKTDKPVTLDAAFYRSAGATLNRVLYPVALIGFFILFMVWKAIASLVYSLLAMAIGNLLGAERRYAELFNISVYAQTLVIVVQMIFLFMPTRPPFFSLAAFAATGTYLYLALRPSAAESDAAA